MSVVCEGGFLRGEGSWGRRKICGKNGKDGEGEGIWKKEEDLGETVDKGRKGN